MLARTEPVADPSDSPSGVTRPDARLVAWLGARWLPIWQVPGPVQAVAAQLGVPVPAVAVVDAVRPEVLRLPGGTLVMTSGLFAQAPRVPGAVALAMARDRPGGWGALGATAAVAVGRLLSSLGAWAAAEPRLSCLLVVLRGLLLPAGPSAARVERQADWDGRAADAIGRAAVDRALLALEPGPAGARLEMAGALRVLGGPAATWGGLPPAWLRRLRLARSARVLPFSPTRRAEVDLARELP